MGNGFERLSVVDRRQADRGDLDLCRHNGRCITQGGALRGNRCLNDVGVGLVLANGKEARHTDRGETDDGLQRGRLVAHQPIGQRVDAPLDEGH